MAKMPRLPLFVKAIGYQSVFPYLPLNVSSSSGNKSPLISSRPTRRIRSLGVPCVSISHLNFSLFLVVLGAVIFRVCVRPSGEVVFFSFVTYPYSVGRGASLVFHQDNLLKAMLLLGQACMLQPFFCVWLGDNEGLSFHPSFFSRFTVCQFPFCRNLEALL